MLCPYCLENTSPPVCESCKETLPRLYVGRNGNPAILSAVGFSGHGKTVYLAGLLDAMEKAPSPCCETARLQHEKYRLGQWSRWGHGWGASLLKQRMNFHRDCCQVGLNLVV